MTAPFGKIEIIKWIALLCMVFDHLNHYIWDYRYPLLYASGRLAFPLFAFSLAYGLAHISLAHFNRISIRLFLSGLLASLFYIELNDNALYYGLPLNIMFTFISSVLLLQLLESGYTILPAGLFILLGWLIEFGYPGLLFCLTCYYSIKYPTSRPYSLLLLFFSLLGLSVINANLWCWFSLMIILLVLKLPFALPRIKYFFYLAYPVHLAIIWFVSQS